MIQYPSARDLDSGHYSEASGWHGNLYLREEQSA